jgi:hypothetical protein
MTFSSHCLGMRIPFITWRRSFSFSPLFSVLFRCAHTSSFLFNVLLKLFRDLSCLYSRPGLNLPSSSPHPIRFVDTCSSFAPPFCCGHVISLKWRYLLLRMSHLKYTALFLILTDGTSAWRRALAVTSPYNMQGWTVVSAREIYRHFEVTADHTAVCFNRDR